MISGKDFEKKQIVMVFFNEGDKITFSNENLIVKDYAGKIKLQVTCYRLFAVYTIGNCSITSVLIQNAKKFNFRIIIMSQSFKVIDLIGYQKDGNTLLKTKQYSYNELDIAKHIIKNKMLNQLFLLKEKRQKAEEYKQNILLIKNYVLMLENANSINEIMAYEGNVSKLFFSSFFDDIGWRGRKPRTKFDYINSILDLAYSLLFNFVDSLLQCFGFDTYVGVLHTKFYMRKSLTCDMVEPFRCIVDKLIRKSINLKQFKEEDFEIKQNEYHFKKDVRVKYVSNIMKEILKYKSAIFIYIKYYYRAFMKDKSINDYPVFLLELT